MIAILVGLSPGIVLFLIVVACAFVLELMFPFQEDDDNRFS